MPISLISTPFWPLSLSSTFGTAFITESHIVSYLETRPRTPWHVGPLKVGLLAVNTPQNPPEPQAHQTRGPTTRPTAHQIHWTTRPTSPPDNGPIRPTGPTTHRPMVKNSEKLWERVLNFGKQWETVRTDVKLWKNVRNAEIRWETMKNNEKQWETVRNGEKRWEMMRNDKKTNK